MCIDELLRLVTSNGVDVVLNLKIGEGQSSHNYHENQLS
jgi:hypothetical protein